jgi:hypothetical protein
MRLSTPWARCLFKNTVGNLGKVTQQAKDLAKRLGKRRHGVAGVFQFKAER